MQLGQRHGWHGTLVLYCSHRTSTCFCMFVSPLAHTKNFRIFERNGYMELWMLLWVRRIPHAERSGRFRLSPGEVKRPRFEAGHGHMPLPSPWGLISNTVLFHRYKVEETCCIFMAPNVSVVKTFQAGWSLSALKRTISTDMISGYGGRTQCLSATRHPSFGWP